MKNAVLFFLITTLICIVACATPGHKYIDIAYPEGKTQAAKGTLGFSNIVDTRTDAVKGQVGFRILLDNSQETYMVNGLDLGKSMTDALTAYFKSTGFKVEHIAPWETTAEGVSKVPGQFEKLIAAKINTFECRAQKKSGHTKMVLDIDLTFFIGQPLNGTLKTLPVVYSLEKTEFTFGEKKLEKFINDSLAEIFSNALSL